MKELLVGCGNRREKQIIVNGRKDWGDLTTLDFDPRCGADIQHDLNDFPYPFRNDEFDEIHAYCVLEHVGRQGDWRFFFDQWAEFWRIAKDGATFHGICPAFNSPWAWGDPSHTRVIGSESLTFLSQKQYERQVGITPMTDFRHYYGADWELEMYEVSQDRQASFVLRARK